MSAKERVHLIPIHFIENLYVGFYSNVKGMNIYENTIRTKTRWNKETGINYTYENGVTDPGKTKLLEVGDRIIKIGEEDITTVRGLKRRIYIGIAKGTKIIVLRHKGELQ